MHQPFQMTSTISSNTLTRDQRSQDMPQRSDPDTYVVHVRVILRQMSMMNEVGQNLTNLYRTDSGCRPTNAWHDSTYKLSTHTQAQLH